MAYYAAYKIGVVSMVASCVSVTLFYAWQKTDQLYNRSLHKQELDMITHIKTVEDALALFSLTIEEVNKCVQLAIDDAKKRINAIISIDRNERTYANTVKAYDELCSLSNMAILTSTLQLLEMVSPDKGLRDAAHMGYLKLADFIIDNVTNNYDVYSALVSYAALSTEDYSAEERYFLDETLKDFMRLGLNLPEQDRKEVKQLKKEIQKLQLEFEKNIANDVTQVSVNRDELQGLEEDFVNGLQQDETGAYILTLDYPTYYAVMDNCSIVQTRKKMYLAFSNRAYPANDAVLKAIVKKRHELAIKLGFSSYAELDLENQMIKNPSRAKLFLEELNNRVGSKVEEEFTMLTRALPDSVNLSKMGKLWPWDQSYLSNQYKKHYLAVDETKLAEYFPMEQTIEGLLDIYRQFLSVEFKEVPLRGAWHEDVKCIQISQKDGGEISGYIFLDLYPRPYKYTHACHGAVVPATYNKKGDAVCGVSLLIANFPKSTVDKPSLLKRSDVMTFFHEFGHAVHSQLGRTKMGSLAGTSVKTDFVEMPSQMLEEWLWDKAILKKISCHYITNDCLSDKGIEAVLNLKHFCKANWIQRQVMLSQFSLRLFSEGDTKDPYAVMMDLYKDYTTHVEIVPENHWYNAFGHLGAYGAKYYSYLWSKVFALDLFDTIKQHGLLNSDIGRKYICEVIGKGGSQDPNELLENFLGRPPCQESFLRDIGISI